MAVGERILVVSPQPFYEDRGTPIAVRRLLEAAQVCGIPADLLSFPIGSDVPIGDTRHYRCSNPLGLSHVPIGLSWRKVALDLSMIPAVRQRLRRDDYFCIHALEEAAFFCTPMARRAGIPIVYDMQSSMPEQLQRLGLLATRPAQALLRSCERWLLRQSDFVMCSEGLAEKVREVMPAARVREWRYATRYTEVSAQEIGQLRQELGIAEHMQTVVYTGTFEHYQGLRELVAAVPRVCEARPDTCFVLAGAVGWLGDEVRALVKKMGLDEHIKIVPRQPAERITVFQRMADVLVSPRAYGGNTPLKIFDYLAAARPIVATNVTSHTAVLDDRLAVLVEPRAQALAEGILSVLTNPARAQSLIASARELAEHICGWKPFVESINNLYQEVRTHAHTCAKPGRDRRDKPVVPVAGDTAARVLHHPRP